MFPSSFSRSPRRSVFVSSTNENAFQLGGIVTVGATRWWAADSSFLHPYACVETVWFVLVPHDVYSFNWTVRVVRKLYLCIP